MDIKGAGLLLGGLTAGLLIGRLPLWGEAPDRAAPAARAAPVVPGTPTQAAAARETPDPEPRRAAAAETEGEARGEPVGEPAEPVVMYGPDGEYECDADCVDGLTADFLSGRMTREAAETIYPATEAMMALIAADPGRRRRFLSLLGASSFDYDEAGTPQDQVALNLVTTYGVPDDLAAAMQRVLEASADPGMRGIALSVAQMRDDPGVASRAVERALLREQDAFALSFVLSSAIGLQEPLSPSGQAALRTLADSHTDPEVRSDAFYALVYAAGTSERDRNDLIERGLTDREPMRRLAALSAAIDGRTEPLTEDETARFRGMAEEVANDPGADPEMRIHALSMMRYGALADEDERRSFDH